MTSDAIHTASIAFSNVSRYFAMAWASRSEDAQNSHWAQAGIEALKETVADLGFDLVERKVDVVVPKRLSAEEYHAMARREYEATLGLNTDASGDVVGR